MKVRVKVKGAGKASGFTMIEIAISLAVIGFALVAIIGILPLGLNVQKDNREDTLVSQDGQYWMDVLRYGRQGTNSFDGAGLDFLTNYVETINVKTYSGTNFLYNNLISDVTYGTPDAPGNIAPSFRVLTNGHVIVAVLSTPQYQPGGKYGVPGMVRNDVTATVRGMSGSALEQNGGNQLVAFKYQMGVTMMPYSTTPWMNDVYTNYTVGVSEPSLQTNHNQLLYLQNGLMDLRMQFSWPVLPNNSTGPNRKYFRTLVSGRLEDISMPNLPLYVINPGAYKESTNTGVQTTF